MNGRSIRIYLVDDEQNTPGLVAHLFESLRQEIAVIGVAKSPFKQTAVILSPEKQFWLSACWATASQQTIR